MAVLLFAISAVLLVWWTLLIVRWFPSERGVRFWAALVAVNLHLTLVHQLASIPHAMNPWGFISTQFVMLVIAVWATPRIARRLGAERGPIPRPLVALVRWPGWRGGWLAALNAALVLGALVIVGFSLTEQMQRPITGFDERMYNCSRVLHWIQHGHIWPWVTNNDAQVDFPIGSEVFFSWPLIFIKEEWPARLLYWMGYPCAIGGVYLLGRLMGISRAAGLGAAAMFAATPTILTASGLNQKQDIWTAAMLLGIAYWVLRCWRRGDRMSAAMAALYLVLAINVKITTIVAAPFVLLAAVAAGGGVAAVRRRVVTMTAVGVVVLGASGLGFTFGRNFAEYRHPFGPAAAAKVLSPDWSVRQVYTHAVRAPMFLMELPAQPNEAFRRWFIGVGNEVLYRLDAHRALPGERRRAWPGAFEFEAGALAYRYSLGGIIWLVAMVWGMLATAKWMLARSRVLPRHRLTNAQLPDSAVVLLVSTAQFVALVFLIRWMGGGADRYWVAPFALGIAAAGVCVDGWIRKKWWAAIPTVLVLVVTVYPSVKTTWLRLERERATPLTAAATDEPYTEIVTKLPTGARILLVANRNTRDYPLFLPRQGYANALFPWGRTKFDESRLARLVNEYGISHAVFEFEDRVGFHWYPGIKVSEMVEWFRARPDFREVPLQTPRQRLFERVEK